MSECFPSLRLYAYVMEATGKVAFDAGGGVDCEDNDFEDDDERENEGDRNIDHPEDNGASRDHIEDSNTDSDNDNNSAGNLSPNVELIEATVIVLEGFLQESHVVDSLQSFAFCIFVFEGCCVHI